MVDFKKAYDSVDRRKLIEVLAKYNVNIHIIEMIVQMYSGDETTIKLGNMQQTVEVMSGIRQGCSISTLLFKMVTFCIIEDLEKQGRKYEIDRYKGNSLWIADDAILITGSTEDLEHNINILKQSALQYGLEICEEKSKVLQVRRKEKPRMVGNFEVVEEVKYLGVKVGGVGRNIYQREKKEVIQKAQVKAAQLMSYIKKR